MQVLSLAEIKPFLTAIEDGAVEELVDVAMANQAATHTLGLWPVVLLMSDATVFLEAGMRKLKTYEDPQYGTLDIGQARLRIRLLLEAQEAWAGIELDALVEELEEDLFVAESLAHDKQHEYQCFYRSARLVADV